MKQIIVITRISLNEPEFPDLYPEREVPVEENFENLSLKVCDGAVVYDDDINRMADTIVSHTNREASEVIFAIHYAASGYNRLVKAILDRSAGASWRVVRYSTTDTNYEDVKKPALQAVATDKEAVGNVYRIFTYDRVLEAKLELLHGCLFGGALPALDELISPYKGKYEIFTGKVAGVEWHEGKYVTALRDLRDSLLETQRV